MKQITYLLIFIGILFACQKNYSTKNCIEYIDSLKINLGNTTLRVAVIDLAQENNVRPYSIFFDNHLIVLNKKDSFYAFDLDCFGRDIIFEQRLNVNAKDFKRAFASFGNLYAIDANDRAFKFVRETTEWMEENGLPFFNKTPIFENDTYLCYYVDYTDTGFLFFYHKYTGKITFTMISDLMSLIEQASGEFYTVSDRREYYSNIRKFENPDSLFKLPDDFTLPDYDVLGVDASARYFLNIMRADTTISPTLYAQLTDRRRFDKNGNVHFPNYVYQSYSYEQSVSNGFVIGNENYFIVHNWIREDSRFQTNFAKLYNDSLIVIDSAIDSIGIWGVSTQVNRNNTVIDRALFANQNDPKDWLEHKDRNLLEVTFIINDSTLIRLNWVR
jgi:hypothetical protein